MEIRALIVCLSLAATAAAADTAHPQFDQAVKSVLVKSCNACHNDRVSSGGLNTAALAHFSSIGQHREEWEKILLKIRTGEMPPKGVPRPDGEQIEALTKFVESEFERADKLIPPDPGRVTARRLNRVEYRNTIRDLLGVDFRADKDFPSDDSGHGFDNIGDVLTISPILMEKYLDAAETIASRALGADPLPKKPVEAMYHIKDKNLRRPNPTTVEASHRIGWDGEYIVRVGLPGQRPADAKPVQMGFWMDGQLLHTQMVETKPNNLVYFNPYSEEEFRIVLPEGDHVFRVGFIGDDFIKTLPKEDWYKNEKNKTLNMVTFIGPFPAKVEKASRKKILICDPASGPACVDKILSTLARRAYRRPVAKSEVAALARFVKIAQDEGQTVEQGLQLAIRAMLVSPHFLFRIERDDPKTLGKARPVSNFELASRLSYFLWSSMPDDELLRLAETGKLREPAVLEAQVKRMLADPKAAALAENFAGQWLEVRNLDIVKPDPQKFPDWSPELRDAMKTETRMFFESLLRENRPLSDFLDARYTFVNETLARHYGIEGVEGPDFQRVELTTDQRGGILGHASVLTVSSYPTRTSPVIRGKYILENILGAPPPAPPPDVPALDEESVGNAGSLRQQLEKHRSNAACASCHSRMDVLGFGLENYDAIGKWRTKDGKFDIDAGGTLPNGQSFATPAELRALLTRDRDDFARCLIEKMMTYALGRGIERYDRRTLKEIQQRVAAAGYRFQPVILEIVNSLPFQSRRAEQSSKELAKR
jgi:mono/diheme cytochrome c family protein